MKKYIAGKGRIAASLLMAAILTMTTVGAAFADGAAQQSSMKQGYFGNVTGKSESSFSVNTRANSVLELAVAEDTQFRVPGMSKASFDDLLVGSRVAVLAEGQDDALTAVKVMLVPGEPQREHRVLTVVEASGNTVVAQDQQGNQVEVVLDEELDEGLEGQLVTFIGDRSQQSNRFKANARVKIGQVVQRMEAQSHKLRERLNEARENSDRERHRRDLARLQERLEANMQEHLDRFAEIIESAPEQAKPHLEEAREMSLKGYRAALEALERPQDHIEARLGQRTVQGIVNNVDADSGQITLQTRGGMELTLDVTSDTRVRMEDQELSLSDIAPGDMVSLKYDRDSSVATDIRIKTEAKAEGVIQGIDVISNQITIELSDGTPLILTLTEQSEVEVNGEEASIEDLQLDARVEIEYNPSTTEVLEIEVDARAEVEGTISSVDADAGTVTIVTEDGAELTLDVTDSTRVKIERILFGLIGLDEGMAVEVRYDRTTGEALEIRVEGKERSQSEEKDEAKVTGTVAGFDSEAGEVIIALDDGTSITLLLRAGTEIEVNGLDDEQLPLADLLDGQRVKVKYDSENLIISEIESEGRGRSGDRGSSLLPRGPKVLPAIRLQGGIGR